MAPRKLFDCVGLHISILLQKYIKTKLWTRRTPINFQRQSIVPALIHSSGEQMRLSAREIDLITFMLNSFHSNDFNPILPNLNYQLESKYIPQTLVFIPGQPKKVSFFYIRDRTFRCFVLCKDTYKVSKSSRSDFQVAIQ